MTKYEEEKKILKMLLTRFFHITAAHIKEIETLKLRNGKCPSYTSMERSGFGHEIYDIISI